MGDFGSHKRNTMELSHVQLTITLCSVIYSFRGVQFRSQWPRCLRPRSAAARLLRSWVRIPPVAWMFICCDCCVLWGKGLCDELITRPEESYRLWCVVVCDLETSRMRRPWPELGRSATAKRVMAWFKTKHLIKANIRRMWSAFWMMIYPFPLLQFVCLVTMYWPNWQTFCKPTERLSAF